MRGNKEMEKQELISRFSKGSFMWIGGACLIGFAGSYFIATSGISLETIKSVGVGCIVVAGCAFVFK
jgi:hypothetical protein